MRLAWEIARRYLAPKKGERFLSFITWISLGGVTVGVTALVLVIAVMTGAQEEFQEKILETNPHILVMEYGGSLRMGNWRAIQDSVRAVEEVVSATPFILTKVMLVRGDYSQSADLYGVAINEMGEAATGIEEMIQSGELTLGETESGLPPVLVGNHLADRMLIFPGDTLQVGSFENLRDDPFGGLYPKIRQFEVTGTFSTGLYDYDLGNLYARLEDVQDLLDVVESDMISGLGIKTTQPWMADEVARAIDDLVGYPYFAQSWSVTNRELFSALRLEKLAMAVILFLIVVVAAFNIVSTLVMVVVERTSEIGILKSMGLTDRRVLHVFVLQGLWIGIIGATAGTFLGCGLAWILDRHPPPFLELPPDIYFVDRIPVALHAGDVFLIYLTTVAVAFVATIYPALQASRLDPVEAIRHE
jgi:lipoprotein-releasing system permease protein